VRKLKTLVAGVAVAAALAVPAMASAAPQPHDPPVFGEPNCAGFYAAYANSIFNSLDAYGNGQKAFADFNGLSVKELKEAIRALCG
jgi:hypothetical protein